jgi:hypothetical protein
MYKNLLFVVLFFTFNAVGQQLSGTISDENDEPLAFATVYPKGSTNGSSTNINGEYQLQLSVGVNQVVFQFVGYKRQVFEVDLSSGEVLKLDVKMEIDIIQLSGLVVNGDGKDPAYYVITQAIKKRKEHLEEVKAYQCNVYIKGIQSITKKPDRVMGFKVTIDTGIVYLSESVSELSYMRPNKVKERMISSKVSGDNRAFSYNQASEMNVNFYENVMTAEGLSERGFISPIANNAFSYYEYELAGIIEEDGNIVNKIKVTPKRKNDPAFTGFIYIIQNSWRIHSVDLVLTKENQIEFIDKLSINQVYAPVDYGIWMMLSQKFTFQLKTFGFEGEGSFMAIHSKYKIEPTVPVASITNTIEEEVVVKIPKKKRQPESKLFPDSKKFFDNEVLAIDEEANQRDSAYWERIRPIPLTAIESKDYKQKDSIKIIIDSKPYKDSVDQKLNSFRIQNILITGFTYRNTFKERFYTFDPLIRNLQYNVVEGLVLNGRLTITQLKKEQPWWRIAPELRYGFASEKLYGQIKGYVFTDIKKFSRIEFGAGHFISQFNAEEPVAYWQNTFQSLINRFNYLKIYEKTFVTIGHQRELKNGLIYTATLDYENRTALENNTDFSFFREGEREFRSNNPTNTLMDNTAFPDHNALLLDVLLRIRFKQKYISRPDRKFIIGSNLPRLNIHYKKGLPILNSSVDFDLLEAKVLHDIDLKMVGDVTISAVFGGFIRNETMFFPDFKHFDGNRVAFSNFNHGSFQLLDYYRYSTNKSYFSSHYEHHFNGFITNKIPLIKKLKLQAVATVNYLNTSTLDQYIEFGIGLEHIFKIGRIDYFTSRSSVVPNTHSIRIGVGF